MIVEEEGQTTGTVGGGPLEARAIQASLQALRDGRSRLLEFVLTDADTTGLGMTCGGEALVLVHAVTTPDAPQAAPLYAALVDLLKSGRRGWLLTELSATEGLPPEALPPGQSIVQVRRALLRESGELLGDMLLPPEAAHRLASTGEVDQLCGQQAAREKAPQIFVEPLGGPATVYLFGAGHCGQALAPLLKMIGLRVVVVDDREEFANKDRFPSADEIVLPPAFDVAVQALPIDDRSFVVIMTRCHAFDRTVLAQALKTPARYIGMIGSKRKVAGIFANLREQGFDEEQLSHVHAPIGLEIGAETPEEIAVSIAAQIIQLRRGDRA